MSDTVQDAIRTAMLTVGVQPAPSEGDDEDHTVASIVDGALHTIPAVGPMLAGGINFVDGLINGDDYREKQAEMEEQQGAFLDRLGVGKIPHIKDVTALAHGAGSMGASIHDFFGWLTD